MASQPYFGRLVAALEANDGDEPGPELSALLAAPQPLVTTITSSAILVLIVGDMVLKPF